MEKSFKKDVTITIDYDHPNKGMIDKIIEILTLLPADVTSAQKGKIEIDWSDRNVIYKVTHYKTIP